MKSILSIKNLIILFLAAGVIVLSVIAFGSNEKCVKEKESANVSYKYNGDYETLCQRAYYFTDTDSYVISLCDNKLYVNKNNSENKEVKVKDVAYLYNFTTPDNVLIYALSNNGDVYHLSPKNIENDSYKLDKLNYKNIVEIRSFYGGSSKEYAYEPVIYAIDNKGNMNKIK